MRAMTNIPRGTQFIPMQQKGPCFSATLCGCIYAATVVDSFLMLIGKVSASNSNLMFQARTILCLGSVRKLPVTLLLLAAGGSGVGLGLRRGLARTAFLKSKSSICKNEGNAPRGQSEYNVLMGSVRKALMVFKSTGLSKPLLSMTKGSRHCKQGVNRKRTEC